MTTTQAQSLVDARQYEQDGFVIARGLFQPNEVAVLDAEAMRLMQRTDLMDTNNIRCRWQDDVVTGECRFDCFDPVIDLSHVCDMIAHHPKLLDALAAIYGEPACLFKDKLIFKPPNAKGYKLHQDYIAWTSFPRTFLTAIVAIDASDRENGGTEVFAGYHTKGSLSAEDGMYHDLPESAVDASSATMLEL